MSNTSSTDAGQSTRSAPDAASVQPLSVTERLARALAPTIFCSPTNVEQCLRESSPQRIAQ